jgi:hypothetical protein
MHGITVYSHRSITCAAAGACDRAEGPPSPCLGREHSRRRSERGIARICLSRAVLLLEHVD